MTLDNEQDRLDHCFDIGGLEALNTIETVYKPRWYEWRLKKHLRVFRLVISDQAYERIRKK